MCWAECGAFSYRRRCPRSVLLRVLDSIETIDTVGIVAPALCHCRQAVVSEHERREYNVECDECGNEGEGMAVVVCVLEWDGWARVRAGRRW